MAKIIQLSENRRDTQDALDRLQKHFTDELVKVEQTITDHMASAATLIPEISAHIVGAGGKRLRPLLTLSAARLSGYAGDKQIMLAAAVEFMHTATLLHDDVVDDSDMRRGRPTARKIWGNPASVLVGDFLLGQAFRMMVTTGSLAALNTLSTAAAIIAEGEVMQMAALQNVQISEDNYLQIIEAKTAALFAAAAEVGGIVANAPEAEIEALKSFGRNLGIAFSLSMMRWTMAVSGRYWAKIPALISAKAKSPCHLFWPFTGAMMKRAPFGSVSRRLKTCRMQKISTARLTKCSALARCAIQ